METKIQTSNLVEIIFKTYKGELKVPEEKLLAIVKPLIESSRSIYNCLAYENSIRFNIPLIYMAVTLETNSDLDNLLMYEILHAHSLGLLTDSSALEFLHCVNGKIKTRDNVLRDMCDEMGFKFKDKKRVKNPLFLLHETVYELSPFPMLDSACSLGKTWTSKKYIPSDLLVGRVSIVSKETIIAVVEKLTTTSSPTVIINTLLKYTSMYDDFIICNTLQQINTKRVTNSPRVLAIAKDILDTMQHILFADRESKDMYLGKLLNIVHSI